MTRDGEKGREDEGGKGIEVQEATKRREKSLYTVPHIHVHALQASM